MTLDVQISDETKAEFREAARACYSEQRHGALSALLAEQLASCLWLNTEGVPQPEGQTDAEWAAETNQRVKTLRVFHDFCEWAESLTPWDAARYMAFVERRRFNTQHGIEDNGS